MGLHASLLTAPWGLIACCPPAPPSIMGLHASLPQAPWGLHAAPLPASWWQAGGTAALGPAATLAALPAAAAPLPPLRGPERAECRQPKFHLLRSAWPGGVPGGRPRGVPGGREPFGTKSGRHGKVWGEEGLRRRVGTEGECMSVSTFLRKTNSCTLNFCLGPSPLNL